MSVHSATCASKLPGTRPSASITLRTMRAVRAFGIAANSGRSRPDSRALRDGTSRVVTYTSVRRATASSLSRTVASEKSPAGKGGGRGGKGGREDAEVKRLLGGAFVEPGAPHGAPCSARERRGSLCPRGGKNAPLDRKARSAEILSAGATISSIAAQAASMPLSRQPPPPAALSLSILVELVFFKTTLGL